MDDRLGRLERSGDRWQLVFRRRLAHPPERVWRALIEPDDLAAWFPAAIVGERVAGARLRFVFPGGEAPPGDGEMLVYEPPTRLEFSWEGEVLRFELEPDGDGTILTFVDRFEEVGKATRDAAGWHVCLGNLERRLRGDEPDVSAAAWQAMERAYREVFPAEASTIGPPEGYGRA